MADIVIRAPVRADIEALLANLRPGDRLEMEASGRALPDLVRSSLRCSPHRWAVDVDGKLALLGGVAVMSLVGGIGSPWLLGTCELDRVPGALTRIGVRYRDLALGMFPVLINYVDARNVKAIRWLKRLGFEVDTDPTPHGPNGLPFFKFELRS